MVSENVRAVCRKCLYLENMKEGEYCSRHSLYLSDISDQMVGHCLVEERDR